MSARRRPFRRRRNQNSRITTRRGERRRALFHEPLEARTLLSGISLTGVPNWVEQGPRPMIDNHNTVINPPTNPSAGAVQSIAINPNLNPDGTAQIYLATVDGGVWRTNNASTTNPAATTWTPLTDQMGSLATSSIAFSPLDPTENTLFAGSSSLSSYGDADGQPILGVLRTTDGGTTWKSFAVSANEPTIKTVLPTAINLASSGPAQEMVLVAGINPHGGLYRSDDNGQTYTMLSGANGLPNGPVTQLIADPGNNQRFYAAVPGSGVFEGDFDSGTKVINWTAFNTNIPAASISSSQDIQLAATNAGGATELYVGLADSSLVLSGVFRSSDSSANWASLGTPTGFVAGQVYQHGFNMVGDPSDNQIVYIAGLGSIGTGGVIFRYDPGTSSWVNITGPGANGTKPHDDSRDMAFVGNNVLVEACDGGFYFLTNPQNAAASQWGSFNGEGASGQGLGANEVHDVAWDSNSHVILAGAQDNGSSYSQVINTNSSQISGDVWTQITGGDGGDVAVDNFTLASVGDSIRYASSQGNSTPNPLDALTRQGFNAAGSPVGPLQYIVPQGLVGFNGLFITPTVLNAVAPTAAQLAAGQSTRMVIGGYQSTNPIYESNNVGSAPANAITWTAVPVAAGFSGTVNALAYGGVHAGVANADVLYAADDQDHIFLRTTAGGTLSPTASPFPGKEVRAISLDPTDWMHAFVASASGVWETTDAGQSCTPRTGNLVNSNLRSVEYVHLASGDVVLVGGQGGVYRMFLNNPGVWTKLGLNLPNDIAYDVDYSPASDVLVVGTFGRGAWTISQASTALSAPPVMQITGDQDAPGENDTFRLVLDPNNPLLLDVFVNNNTAVPDEQLPLASLQQINVDGLGGNDTLIVDDSNGLINLIGGIHYDGGTGFNTLQIVQTGGATEKSDVYSVGPNNGEGSDVIMGPTGTQTIQFQNLAPVLDTVPATTATANGTPADNAINYTTGSVAANGLVTIDNQESYEFSNKTNLVINGGAGSDTINLNNSKQPSGLTAITVNGGDPTASDTLIVNGIAGVNDDLQVTPSGTGSGGITDTPAAAFVPVTYTGIEHLSVVGQTGDADGLDVSSTAGNDAYTFVPGATGDAGTITGTANNGTFNLTPIALSGFRSFITPLAFNLGGTDTLTIDGTPANDVIGFANQTFPLGGIAPAVTVNGGTPLFFSSGLANLVVNGLTGNDIVNALAVTPLPQTTINLSGSAVTTGEVVNLTGDGTPATVALSGTAVTISGGGLGTVAAPLTITGAGTVNFNNGAGDITFGGTAGADALNVTPTSANTAAIQVNGVSPVLNATTTGILGFGEATPDGDSVTVNGTSGNDTINVVRGAMTTVQVNSLKTVSLTTANTEALVVATGAGTDRVNVSGTAGPASLAVNGGTVPAADTLAVTNSTSGTTTVVPGATPDAGTVQTPDGNVGFTGMTLVTLAGAAVGDTLVAKGTNSADNMALQFLGGANRIWVNSQAVVSFSSFGTVTLQGLFGDDKFSVTPVGLVGVTAINIAGGDPTASDSLLVNGTTGADTIGFAPTAADAGMVTVNAAAPITFSTTESVTINGLGGGDALTVTTPAGPDTITYNPGATLDSAALKVGSLVPMNFMNLGAGSVQLADAGGGAVDSLIYNGTAASDTFTVVGTGGGAITLNKQIQVRTPGIANLTLDGLAGDDTFNLTGALPFATTTLDGGDPSSSDIANLAGATGAVAVNLGDSAANPPTNTTITGYGGTVTLTGVEVANLDAGGNALTVNGTAHNDALTYTPTGSAAGTVTDAGLNTIFNFTNALGTFTIDPAGGNNTLIVNGTSGNDTINVVRGASTTVQVNSLKTVSLTTADTEALVVATGAGTDRVNVSGTAGPASLTVNGGGTPAADTLAVTNSTVGTTTVVPGATPDAGTVQTPDGNVSFTGMTLVTLAGAAAGDTLVAKGTNSADNMALQFLGGANRLWVNSQAVVSFSSFGTVTLQGLFGDDKFSVTPVGLVGVTAINVAGGDPTASDSLLVNGTTGADTIGFAPTAADAGTVTVNAAAPIAFSTTESVNINGLGGGDALTVTLPAGPNAVSTLTPGATFDSGSLTNSNATEGTLVPLAFSHLGFGGGLTVNDLAGPIDSLVYNGLSAGDIFQVNGAVITLDSQLPVRGPGVGNLSLVGQGGSDRFVVAGPQPYFTTLIGGGESSTDIANLDGATGPVILAFGNNAGSFALINGYGAAVSVTGIGNVNFDAGGNGLTAFASRNDSVIYTPTGTAAGTLTDSGPKTTFNFANVAGTFNLVDGAGGTNQLTVNGTGGRDLFEIDQGARTVQVLENNVSALKAITFDMNFSILNAVGLAGPDTFQVIPAAGLAPFPLDNLVINIDGDSGPTGANNALVVGSSFVTGAGTPTPLPPNNFVVDDRHDLNSGTLRVYQSGVANPDINYTNVQVVSPTVAGPANLLVMGPDSNEPNETQAGATILGSAQTIMVPHATIFPNASEFPGVPADQDYYSVTAQQTGTLDFVATFRLFNPALLPGGGNLNLQVLDAAGNVIATASGGAATFGAVGALPAGSSRIRIPAVAGQTYFLHVFGANLNGLPNGAVVNGYDLSVVDTPSAVPFGIELSRSVAAGVAGSPDTGDLPANAPADDTGRSQFDNVTNNNKPRIYLRLADGTFLNDLPGNSTPGTPPVGVIPIPFSPNATTAGFRVAIFDGDNTQTPVGFATQVFGVPGLYQFDFPTALADGVHHLTAEVQMVDPATPTATGFGGASASFDLTVDTAAPPVSFGSTGVATSGLDGPSDSGVNGQPDTIADRITNVSTPTLYGVAEANAIVRLYDDVNNNGVVDAGDVFLGQTTAVPGDGTNANANGQWRITSNVDLNDPKLGFPLDGVRHLVATAEDLAGNLSPVQSLTIFVDTQGPRVNNVGIAGSPGFNVFLNKLTTPPVTAPTPLVNGLDITFTDRPIRVGPDFVYPAVNPTLATTVGNYELVGEHSGRVQISSITFADSTASGTPGTSVATLHFAAPLADDRYTLTISDRITDNAGNPLDAEFNGATFPAGNGNSGGSFVGSFTVNSRPHIGVYSAGTVDLDLNGNGTFDPQNPDTQNRDAVITLGYPSDRLFSGKFADASGTVNGFDKLAAYGFVNGQWRWIFDQGGLGSNEVQVPQAIPLDGLPVAGNWTNTKGGADHVGVFTGDTWWLDVLGQGSVTPADLATPATATNPAGRLPSDMVGLPVVGDFDGDGKIDLATYQNGVFEFDLSSLEPNGIVTGQWNAKINVQPLLPNNIGFSGVLARPVAADMNGDGTTDIGLYWPGRTDSNPGTAQWYFLVSDPAAATPAAKFGSLNQTFQDETLGGRDIYYQFGDQFALPLVGNFDPPSSGAPAPSFSSTSAAADWIARLYVQILGREPGTGDLTNWVNQINQGLRPIQVAQSFVDSVEHRGEVIDQLYQQYLGRHADAEGSAFWISVWNAAGGPELVQAGIIGSPEYYATAGKLYPGLSADAAWVTALYRNILGRDVDQKGLDYWVDYIQNHSKQSVVLGFVTSDEYRLQLIAGWYETYLGRAIDQAGAAYWLHQLQQGMPQDQIAIGILASDEYRNRS